MTYQTDCTLPEELLEQIAQQGLDAEGYQHPNFSELKAVPAVYP